MRDKIVECNTAHDDLEVWQKKANEVWDLLLELKRAQDNPKGEVEPYSSNEEAKGPEPAPRKRDKKKKVPQVPQKRKAPKKKTLAVSTRSKVINEPNEEAPAPDIPNNGKVNLRIKKVVEIEEEAHSSTESDDISHSYLKGPKLDRYKEIAKKMKFTVLPTEYLLPKHVITTQRDYERYMKTTKWRFVVYPDADVDAHNSVLNVHVKDKPRAPYAQELPSSD